MDKYYTPEELRQMYEKHIGNLVRLEGGTMEAMREREPFEEWVGRLRQEWEEFEEMKRVVKAKLALTRRSMMTPNEAYKCLHDCRYCGSFTGNDVTGCEGALTPCPAFRLDLTVAPEWAKDCTYLFKQDE